MIRVGPIAEGFCASSEGAREERYCLPHFKGCQRIHNISREGVLDIGYLMHPGKVLDAEYSPYVADSLGKDLSRYVDGAPEELRETCRRAARELASVWGQALLSLDLYWLNICRRDQSLTPK